MNCPPTASRSCLMSWLKYIKGLILGTGWLFTFLWINREVILQGGLKAECTQGIQLRFCFILFCSLLLFLRFFCTCLQSYWQSAPSNIKTQEFTYWVLTLALYREWKWPLISRVGNFRKYCFLSSCTSVSSFSLWPQSSQIGIYTLSEGWQGSGSWLDGSVSPQFWACATVCSSQQGFVEAKLLSDLVFRTKELPSSYLGSRGGGSHHIFNGYMWRVTDHLLFETEGCW